MDPTQQGINPLALALMQGAGMPNDPAGIAGGMPSTAGVPYGLAPQGAPAPSGPVGAGLGQPVAPGAPMGMPAPPVQSMLPGAGVPAMGAANAMPRLPFGFGSAGYGGSPYQGY